MNGKLFHIAVMGLLLLPACTKQGEAAKQAIRFSQPALETKALVDQLITGTAYPTAENFTAYAAKSAGDWADGASAPGDLENFFSGVDCGYSGSGNSWDPASGSSGTAYYWTDLGSTKTHLNVRAYSPTGIEAAAYYTGAAGSGITHDWNDGFTLTHYQMPAVGSQVDIMLSDLARNFTASTSNGHVALHFSHILSAVVFMVALHDSFDTHTHVFIKGLEIRHLFDKGIYEQSTGTWTPESDEADEVSVTVCDEPSGVELQPALYNVDEGWYVPPHVFLPVPQDLTHTRVSPATTTKVSLRITYAFSTQDGTLLEETKEVDLPDQSDDTKTWEAGKRYVYRIFIQPNGMEINLKIIGWADPTTINL